MVCVEDSKVGYILEGEISMKSTRNAVKIIALKLANSSLIIMKSINLEESNPKFNMDTALKIIYIQIQKLCYMETKMNTTSVASFYPLYVPNAEIFINFYSGFMFRGFFAYYWIAAIIFIGPSKLFIHI